MMRTIAVFGLGGFLGPYGGTRKTQDSCAAADDSVQTERRRVAMLIRAIAVWLVIIAAETISGALRRLWLIPFLGETRAGQIGFVVGAIIIVTSAWLFMRWMRAESKPKLLLVGLLWATLTLSFEIALGRLVLDYSWARIAADYDITQGGLMLIGIILLLFGPLIAAKLRSIGPEFDRR